LATSAVTHVEVFKLNVRVLEPIRVAIGTVHHATNILVKIHTGDGLTGLGEDRRSRSSWAKARRALSRPQGRSPAF